MRPPMARPEVMSWVRLKNTRTRDGKPDHYLYRSVKWTTNCRF